MKCLERNKITLIDAAIGSKFDFNKHEVIVEAVDESKEAGSIAFVCQDGFKIGQRILRATKVGVIKTHSKPNN